MYATWINQLIICLFLVTTSTTTAVDSTAWRQLHSMPNSGSELSAAVIGTTINMSGGFGGTASAEAYDTTTDHWSAGPPLPITMPGVSATTVSGLLYIAGGFDSAAAAEYVGRVFRLQISEKN